MALHVIRIEISPENLFFNINHKSLLLRDNIRASETSVQINKIDCTRWQFDWIPHG
jgi:hypothetical protein